MKKIKKLITVALAGVTIFSFAGCNMIERTEESKQKTVLAKVGDEKITRADVDKALQAYLDYFRQQYGDDFEEDESLKSTLKTLRTNQLNGLIDQQVLLQSKNQFGINPTDEEIEEEVDDRVDYIKTSLGSDDAYENYIESYGYDNDSFNEYLKEQVVLGMIVDAMVEDVEVTDEDIESYYNDNINEYVTKAGADVTHILFTIEKDSDGNEVEGADEAAKAKAEAARQEALAGKSLKDISEEEQFKDTCKYEDLGRVDFEDSGMVKEFEDAFKVLPANQVSDVIKTDFGYHVIVNTAVYSEDEVKPLDDVLKEEIKGKVLYNKQEEAYNEKLEELKDKLKVKIYENRI